MRMLRKDLLTMNSVHCNQLTDICIVRYEAKGKYSSFIAEYLQPWMGQLDPLKAHRQWATPEQDMEQRAAPKTAVKQVAFPTKQV